MTSELKPSTMGKGGFPYILITSLPLASRESAQIGQESDANVTEAAGHGSPA
jgi:hypothetical protein